MRRARTYASLLVLAPALAASSDAVAEPEIRVDAGMSAARVPTTDRSGMGFIVEIKGLANDNLSIGGRIEFGMLFGGHVGNDERPIDFAMAACGLLKAEYHFLPGLVRPFVSAGAGVYSLGSTTVDGSAETAPIKSDAGRFFGVAPQAGVDLGRLRLAATYNIIVGGDFEVVTLQPMAMSEDVSQNYFSLELSFAFGKPRKPPPPAPPQPAYPAYPAPAYPAPAYPAPAHPAPTYPQQPTQPPPVSPSAPMPAPPPPPAT
jgi:hypothetical protein